MKILLHDEVWSMNQYEPEWFCLIDWLIDFVFSRPGAGKVKQVNKDKL